MGSQLDTSELRIVKCEKCRGKDTACPRCGGEGKLERVKRTTYRRIYKKDD